MLCIKASLLTTAGGRLAAGNEWRQAEDFPIPAAPTKYYLSADGLLQLQCPPSPSSTPIVADPAARAVSGGAQNHRSAFRSCAKSSCGLLFIHPPIPADRSRESTGS